MIAKSYEIERKSTSFLKYKTFLLYGENGGLKKDIKELINKTLSKDEKDTEHLLFFENDLIENEDTFYDTIYNGSLFGNKKIITINNASDKIIDKIENVLEKCPENTFLFIISDNLEKKSKLRHLFEKSSDILCIPCYLDSERDLQHILQSELKKEKMKLSKEIINFLIDKSNNDRGNLKKEVEKIKILFKNKKELNINEIKSLINFSGEIKNDNFINQCLCGNTLQYKKMLSELHLGAVNQIYLLRVLSNKIQRLLKMKEEERNYGNIDALLNSTRPPIFWQEKPIVKKQLTIWNLEDLKSSINKINQTEILCKKNPNISKIISFNLFTEICAKASNYS